MPETSKQKIVYLTAGAAGMFCGSCMHDNTLARALSNAGWDIQLVPTYTPIRTDETDFSADMVFFGGINIFLQQKIPLLRFVPRFLDRILDNPKLIRRVTSGANATDPKMLGELAVSMLQGGKGNQRKEVKRLCDWLDREQPDLVMFSNALIGGCIPEIKRRLDVPIIVTLQGDDVFLDYLAPAHKTKCIDQIHKISAEVDGFIVHSEFFRDYMAEYFGLPIDKIHVTPLGLDVNDFEVFLDRKQSDRESTIGYLARLSPEKGLHLLVEAFVRLKRDVAHANTKLKIAGWLGEENREFAERQFAFLRDAGLESDFEYLGAVTRAEKIEMLGELDLVCVPTEFLEPKGLYALEALAAGVPVVKPAHGCFVELIEQSEGGILFDPNNVGELVATIGRALQDREALHAMGMTGQKYVHAQRNAERMAAATSELIESFLTGQS